MESRRDKEGNRKDKEVKKAYQKPKVEGQRFYERRALACAKNEDVDIPNPGCLPPGSGYDS